MRSSALLAALFALFPGNVSGACVRQVATQTLSISGWQFKPLTSDKDLVTSVSLNVHLETTKAGPPEDWVSYSFKYTQRYYFHIPDEFGGNELGEEFIFFTQDDRFHADAFTTETTKDFQVMRIKTVLQGPNWPGPGVVTVPIDLEIIIDQDGRVADHSLRPDYRVAQRFVNYSGQAFGSIGDFVFEGCNAWLPEVSCYPGTRNLEIVLQSVVELRRYADDSVSCRRK